MDGLQILVFLGVLVGLSVPLGAFMARVYRDENHALKRSFGWLERAMYRFAGVDPNEEMTWRHYAFALVAFNVVGCVVLQLLQLAQASLPLNPQNLSNVPFVLALNTTISFVTNTNWQAYSGEATLSYFTQMVGLTVQNFVSAATGLAVAVALARGFARKSSGTLGNFWADLVRSTVYVLVPLSLVLAVVLIGQGVVQTFSSYATAHTVEGATQVIPLGPAASQIAIKQIGTNGGGFFGVNSAHPFENPTPFANFLEMLSILLVPAALVVAFGGLVGDRKQGWTLYASMMGLFLFGLAVTLFFESQPNLAPGGLPFLEGKETRFGLVNSSLWSVATTAASNGSVNAMLGSYSPIGGLVALFNIMLGEVVFGGVGAGLYGMLMYVILTVFIAGLMVGRTPEYLGKKIEAREIVLAAVALLAPSVVILCLSAVAARTDVGLASLGNKGPHGLSEILYAFASAAGNNGSAFGGLTANTNFYNLTTGFAMLFGRFIVIIPVLAIAGLVAAKKKVPASLGTFPTDGALFVVLLTGVIVIVGALTFFPALALGPLMEHVLMGARNF